MDGIPVSIAVFHHHIYLNYTVLRFLWAVVFSKDLVGEYVKFHTDTHTMRAITWRFLIFEGFRSSDLQKEIFTKFEKKRFRKCIPFVWYHFIFVFITLYYISLLYSVDMVPFTRNIQTPRLSYSHISLYVVPIELEIQLKSYAI